MSAQPRYTLIGGFVVGACAILVITLLFFGSGKLFRQSITFVSYFSGSVKGLSVGAPVSFRGAKIGTVTDINLVYKETGDLLLIPVEYEIEPDVISGLVVNNSHELEDAPLIRRLIEKGLRAQLAMESLVTGQLYVQLDFFPDTSPYFMQPSSSTLSEIPSVSSAFEKIRQKIEDLPVEEIARNLQQVLTGLDKFLSSDELPRITSSLDMLLGDLDKLARNIDSKGMEVLDDGKELIANANNAMLGLSATLKSVDGALEPGHPVTRRIILALEEVTAAARAIKNFADYAERHPEAFVRGKR